MNSPSLRKAVLVSICVSGLLMNVRGAEGDLEQLKAQLKAEIEAQTKAIRESYEAQIQQLEKRVQTLEQDNQRLKNTAAPIATPTSETMEAIPNATSTEATPDSAKKEAIEAIELKLHESATETREIYRDDAGWPFDITKFYDLPRPLEFHGYARAGFGMNGEGGKMEAFKAPGAGAKYRLGNEADAYGEFGLTYNWLRADDPLKSPYVRTTVMIAYSTMENFSYDSLNNVDQGNDIALRQMYVDAGNVFQSAPEIRFWAGQRYYRRHDIHINDFFYLDMSGYGGGVEDIPIGSFGKLALAWLGGSVDNYATDDGNAAKQNIDLRLYDVKAPFGKLTFWFDFAHTHGGEVNDVFNPDGSPFEIDTSSGFAFGLIHRTEGEKLWGGYNEFSIQYGNGAAYNFASTLDSSGPDLDEAWRFRVTDHITIQPSPHFSMQLVGIYEETDFGGANAEQWWASAGARTIYHITDRFSLALEAGIDWAESEPLGTDGHLWKISFAPQISRGGKFFSRPVIRPFITYAHWSDGFRGLIGGNPYENKTQGISYGIQAETWW